MPKYKRITSTLLTGFLAEIFNKIIPFFLYSFALRKIGTGGFGFALYGVSIIEMSIPFITLGYNYRGSISVGKSSRDTNKISEIISHILPLKLINAILTLALFIFITSFIPSYAPYKLLLLALSFSFFTSSIECLWVHMGLQKLAIVNIVTLFSKILTTILVVSLIKGADDSILFAVLMLSSNAFIGLFTSYYMLSRYPIKVPNLKILFSEFKYSLSYGALLILTTLIVKIDMLLVERFFPAHEMGIYAGLNRLEYAITTVLYIFFSTFLSEIFSVKSNKELEEHIQLSTLSTWSVLCPILFASWLVGGKLLNFIFNSSYSDSGNLFATLMLGTFAFMFIQIFGLQVLVSREKKNTVIFSCLIAICLSVLSSFLLAKNMSLHQFIMIIVLSKILAGSLCFIAAKNYIKLPLQELIMPIIPSAIMFTFMSIFSIENLLFNIIFGFIIYALAWYLIFPKKLQRIYNKIRTFAPSHKI